jgi:CheY-like chemotaxis protein
MAEGTVLVVDDDPGIRETLTAILEDAGYTVATAVDGAALRAARDLQPHVILLDIMMPVMDGVEVSQRLRADPATEDIPIIAMSAHYQLQAMAGSMPVDDQLAKPFDLIEVERMVARWMQGRG